MKDISGAELKYQLGGPQRGGHGQRQQEELTNGQQESLIRFCFLVKPLILCKHVSIDASMLRCQ